MFLAILFFMAMGRDVSGDRRAAMDTMDTMDKMDTMDRMDVCVRGAGRRDGACGVGTAFLYLS